MQINRPLTTEKRPTRLIRGLAFRGARYLAKGRYDQALADFDRAIELGAADAWFFVGRGNTYVTMGRYDQALADYDRAIELDAADAWVFLCRGMTYGTMGRNDQALADFDHAIELGAADAWVFFGRGAIYRLMGRYDDALADFDRAIELDPTGDEFAAARTEICQLTGRSDTDDAEPANYSETLTDPDPARAAAPSSAGLAARARGELNAHPAQPLCRIDTDGWDLSVSWHPDGRSIAFATGSTHARVYDISGKRPEEKVAVKGGSWIKKVLDVAFSPDGTRLATGSDDKSARVWDAASGRQLLEVRHDHWVRAVAFSPDGTRLATGTIDGSAQVWDAAVRAPARR